MKSALLFFLFLFSSTSFAQKKLVVLGDSLTEGIGVAKESAFPHLLEQKIKAQKKDWTVVNSGISGSTTASAPGRLKWVMKTKPDAILLILGANDGLRGLDVGQSEKNLSLVIEAAQKDKVKIMLGGIYMPPNYGKEYSEKFKAMYRRLANKYKVPLVPFILEKVAGDPKYNLPDGMHPNEEGHKLVAENIFQSIKDQL